MTRAQKGMSMLEVVIAMAIFAVFLIVLVTMTAEMRRMERKYPVHLMKHPHVAAVISRMRKDVIDANALNPYPFSHAGYSQTKKTLIVDTLQGNGTALKVVWDFSQPGQVVRKAYGAGTLVSSEWRAMGTPDFEIDTYQIGSRPPAVRLRTGNNEIDQIFQPRAY